MVLLLGLLRVSGMLSVDRRLLHHETSVVCHGLWMLLLMLLLCHVLACVHLECIIGHHHVFREDGAARPRGLCRHRQQQKALCSSEYFGVIDTV